MQHSTSVAQLDPFSRVDILTHEFEQQNCYNIIARLHATRRARFKGFHHLTMLNDTGLQFKVSTIQRELHGRSTVCWRLSTLCQQQLYVSDDKSISQ